MVVPPLMPPALETPLPLPPSLEADATPEAGPSKGGEGNGGADPPPAALPFAPCHAPFGDAATSGSQTTPVEILFKPKPAYTLEAQELHLEGEVLLNVVFLASGGIRLLHIVHGLGHGLDEAAAEAAAHIRFRPASCGGVPRDMNATVHVGFRLNGRRPRSS
jgi:TonB family protein